MTDGRLTDGPDPGRQILAEFSQFVFLQRLLGLGLLVFVGSVTGWASLAAAVVICTVSVVGAVWLHQLQPILTKHPSIVLVDIAACALGVVVAADSFVGFAAIAITSPLLIGALHDFAAACLTLGVFLCLMILAIGVIRPPESSATEVRVFLLTYVVGFAAAALMRSRVLAFSRSAIASRRALAASEERARLAREMHDGVVKTLHGIGLSAKALQAHPDLPTSLHNTMAGLADAAQQGAAEARDTLTDLRSEQDDRPMAVVVGSIVERWSNTSGIPAHVALGGGVDVADPEMRECIFACLREAMDNVREHADATTVHVNLHTDDLHVVLKVADNGKGIDSRRLVAARRQGHYGVVGMKERAEAVGGSLSLKCSPGTGTTVSLALPYGVRT